VSIEKQLLQRAGGVVPVTRMLIRRNEHMQEMIYWFRTRSGTVNGEYALKWDLVKNSLARRPTDAVFVRYLAPIENADDMRELMNQLDAPLNSILAEVGLQ
jgi:EpsI family protein